MLSGPQIAFLTLCIPIRLILVYFVYNLHSRLSGNVVSKSLCQYRLWTLVFLTVIGFGFLTIYHFGLRKTGLETGGRPIWWDQYRPLHGFLFLLSAFLLSRNHSLAYLPLLLDVILGLLVWTQHYQILH